VFLIILINLCNVRCFFLSSITSEPLCNAHRNRQLTSCSSCTKLPCREAYRQKGRGLSIGTVSRIVLLTRKKLQSMQNCMHCACKGKMSLSAHEIKTSYKCKQCDFPLCCIGYFWSIWQKGTLKFKIEACMERVLKLFLSYVANMLAKFLWVKIQ
jgi:hypothetical protein